MMTDADAHRCDALERHEAEMYRLSAGALPGATVADLGGATLIAAGPRIAMPFFNGAHCVRTTPGRVDALIERVVRSFAALDLPPHVHLTPASTPADVGERLERAEFLPRGREAVLYHAGGPPVEPDPRIRIVPVGPASRDDYLRVLYQGFDIPSFLWAGFRALHEARAANAGFASYLASIESRPVGVATTFRSENGVGGLYHLATLSEDRGRGVGTALVAHAIAESRRRGDAALCLQTVAVGDAERLYTRLGFRRAYVRVDYIRQG